MRVPLTSRVACSSPDYVFAIAEYVFQSGEHAFHGRRKLRFASFETPPHRDTREVETYACYRRCRERPFGASGESSFVSFRNEGLDLGQP